MSGGLRFRANPALVSRMADRGWKDRVGLETDPDFDAIRGDKRFGEMIARLELKAAPGD
jgi:hypothetical protein